MKIKKLLSSAKLPVKAYPRDAGFDVFAPYGFWLNKKEVAQVKLGVAIELNSEEVCIMSERSGMAIKFGITSIGNVIDANYRGEISIILINLGTEDVYFNQGDRIGQMLIMQLGNQRLEEVEQLSETTRGNNAHYSSGV